jgi:ubiquinone/menaquinone biosynthesis C-methylase UbiE
MGVEEIKLRWYGAEDVNNDAAFRKMIYEAVGPESRVLDAGAGAGDLFLYALKGRVREIIGVDLDPRVKTNTQLDLGIEANLTAIPIEESYFDVIFSRYVLEHIAEPQAFLHEIRRILRPEGLFLFLTRNKWHYVSVAARLTPQFFHNWYNNRRGRRKEDTFPTVYRLNSVSSIRKHFRRAGFRELHLVLRECCPNYLTFSVSAFALGVAYERIVNSSQLLAGLRVNILGCFEKQ